MNEIIICAAIRIDDSGKLFFGHRHDQCINALNSELSWNFNRREIAKMQKTQGFVTSLGRFVDRTEALKIALGNNQVKDITQIRGHELYSEDLY